MDIAACTKKEISMHLSKVGASVDFLFLVSCASNAQENSKESTVQSEAVNSSTSTPSPSVQPTSSTKMDGSVTFEKVDSTLIAPGSKFDIQFSTESTTNCSHTIKYPQVSSLANTAIQAKLNQSLRQNMIEQMRITGGLLDGNRCPQAEGELRLYTRAGGCRTQFNQYCMQNFYITGGLSTSPNLSSYL